MASHGKAGGARHVGSRRDEEWCGRQGGSRPGKARRVPARQACQVRARHVRQVIAWRAGGASPGAVWRGGLRNGMSPQAKWGRLFGDALFSWRHTMKRRRGTMSLLRLTEAVQTHTLVKQPAADINITTRVVRIGADRYMTATSEGFRPSTPEEIALRQKEEFDAK